MNISIVPIGDELLIGQVVDTNSAWMAKAGNKLGFRIKSIYTISDQLSAIHQGLAAAQNDADIILITGGLGPTKDDVTKLALAEFIGDKLVHSEESWKHINFIFNRFGKEPLEMHKQQALIPSTATLLGNEMGTALGMWMEYQGKIFVSMPGVPYEMKHIMTEHVFPALQQRYSELSPIEHRTVRTFGRGEGQIAVLLDSFETQLPEGISLAYLPGSAQVRVRLSLVGSATIEQLEQSFIQLKEILGPLVFGEGETSLPLALGQLLQSKGLMMGTAESCTGGYISHLITNNAGSSAYYEGAAITYSNALKMERLNVAPSTLEKHGAVSAETVREMLSGLLKNLKVDVGIAISGIAGPSGGTKNKPVGTVWIAVGNNAEIKTYLINVSKNRQENIKYSANKALGLLWKFVRDHY